MNEKAVFEVFNGFREAYVSEAHFQLMNDLPMLTDYASFIGYATQYYNRVIYNANVVNGNSRNIALFLPPEKHEPIDDYISRLGKMAPFNPYKSMINSVIGLMTRKPAKIENETKADAKYLDTVANGDWWGCALKTEVFPAALAGIGGILVDYENGEISWQIFDNRSISRKHIIKEKIKGREFLKRAVIISYEKRECEDRPFEYEEVEKALVLSLIEKSSLNDFMEGSDYSYSRGKDPDKFVAVWEQFENKNNEIDRIDFGVYQSQNGNYLNTLPFHLFSSTQNGDAPFFSAAKKTFSFMNMESFFDQALEVANYPMMQYKSDSNSLPGELNTDSSVPKEELKLSARSIFEIAQDDDISFIEWEGKPFVVTMDRLAQIVVQIGAMIIHSHSDQKNVRTKAEYEGQQTTDTSSILGIVEAVEKAIQAAVATSHNFLALSPESMPIISLNKDFVHESYQSGMIDDLLKLYDARLIAGDTALKTLAQKEVIFETSMELEQQKIQKEDFMNGGEPIQTDE